MSKELVDALDALEAERGIDRSVVVDALEDALKAAYKKQYNTADNVEATFDDKKGNISIKQVKNVVLDDDLDDDETEISLSDALALNRAYEAGDEIRFDVTPKDFGRMAAQAAKQVIVQKCVKQVVKRFIISLLNMKTKLLPVKSIDKIHVSCM